LQKVLISLKNLFNTCMSFENYPKNIGKILEKATFSQDQLESLKNNLSKKVIIRVYGLAGVGKGTLSESLAKSLQIPNLESSMILRIATFGYLKLGLELSDLNTQKVFEKIDIKVVDNSLEFYFENKFVDRKSLKNPVIDKNVTDFSSDLFVRQKFDDTLDNLVQKVFKTAVVADGRGAFEPYLLKAEKSGFKIIRVLLDSSDEIKAKRYYRGFIKSEKAKNPDFDEKVINKQEFLKEFEKTVVQRNQKDITNILDKKIGLISKDSGLIETSNLSPQEVLETTLDFIAKSL